MFNSCSQTNVPPSVTAPLPSHSTNVSSFSAGRCKQLSERPHHQAQRPGAQVTAAGGNELPRGFQTTLLRVLLNYTHSLRLKLCLDATTNSANKQTSHKRPTGLINNRRWTPASRSAPPRFHLHRPHAQTTAGAAAVARNNELTR